jgi:hypothetical protein
MMPDVIARGLGVSFVTIVVLTLIGSGEMWWKVGVRGE